MATRRAKILDPKDLEKVLKTIDTTSKFPLRDKLVVLLTAKSGLRVMEVARLRWHHVTNADGTIAKHISLMSDVTKRGRERTVPMHDMIRDLLKEYRSRNAAADRLFRFRLTAKRPEHALVMWFKRLYEKVGLEGCSSHSGRRTFITSMGRIMNNHQCSLKDIQLLAGHANIATTESYLEPQKRVVGMINAI